MCRGNARFLRMFQKCNEATAMHARLATSLVQQTVWFKCNNTRSDALIALSVYNLCILHIFNRGLLQSFQAFYSRVKFGKGNGSVSVRTFKKRQVDYFTVSWRQFSLSAMFMLAVVFDQFTLTKLLRPNLPHFLSQVFMGIFLSDARNCRVECQKIRLIRRTTRKRNSRLSDVPV